MAEAFQVRSDGGAPADSAAGPQGELPDRVLPFSGSRDRAVLAVSSPNGSGKRDWSAALDLVDEAFEAIRMAEERANAAEAYQSQLIQHHNEQVRALEMRLAGSDKRAEAAEARAKDAEAWLSRYHDKIVDRFQRTFVEK